MFALLTDKNEAMNAATDTQRLILASSSPRRRELLREARYDFEAIDPAHEEPGLDIPGLTPAQRAEALAYFKARSVFERRPGAVVLGADTICAVDNEVMGKPEDAGHARRMLRKLSRTPHRVITGVALLSAERRRIASEVTMIQMRPMSPSELDAYIASGEWIGKAGGYAIQETADRFVTRVDGSFSNVVGLPMGLVRRLLSEAGVD
jgi:septum formation protein